MLPRTRPCSSYSYRFVAMVANQEAGKYLSNG
jgi:hypothetical protein